jgi:hypothetical protein
MTIDYFKIACGIVNAHASAVRIADQEAREALDMAIQALAEAEQAADAAQMRVVECEARVREAEKALGRRVEERR